MSSGSHGRGGSSSQGGWFEVVEIVEEDGKRYKVRWAGKDPKTGQPWPLDWVPKSNCSPNLIEDWKKKKGAVFSQLRYADAFKCGNNTAKKRELLSSSSVSTSMRSQVALKRPSKKRHAASASEPPVRSTRKRKHPTPPSFPSNADEDSAPRRKRLATAAAESTPGGARGQSTEFAHALPNREDRQPSPSHPPLEEIAIWVPTPNAKFGPPKRKRTIGERRDPPKKRPVDIADSAKPPVQASIPAPSSPRPMILSESQIVALREEEEESQSQSQTKSNRPGGPVEDSTTTSDPVQPTVDSNGATEVSKGNPPGSPEGLIGRPSVDIQLTNPNVNNGHVSGPNSQGVHLQSNVMNISMQGGGVTEAPKGSSPLPAAPHITLFNFNPSTSAISLKSPQVEMPAKSGPPQVEIPSKSGPPQVEIPTESGPPPVEMPVKSGPPQIGKPGTSSAEQSKSGPRRSGNGTLAERRAFEARVRLDELRRAGATFGKGHTALNASQSFKQPPPHVVLKEYKDVMGSPSQSQVTHTGISGNEILGSVSPSQNRRADFSDEPEVVDLVINKSGQDANVGSLPQNDGDVAANILVVRVDCRSRPPRCVDCNPDLLSLS